MLRRQGAQAREALQTLLVDRVNCTPVLVAGARAYAFTGDGTFGEPLAANTLHDPAVIRKILAHLALGHSAQSPGPAPPESAAAAP